MIQTRSPRARVVSTGHYSPPRVVTNAELETLVDVRALTMMRARTRRSDEQAFDPLEMDRYTHMQQLSRSLIESASDLQDLRDTFSNKIRDIETLLLQQSRVNTELQEGLMRSQMVPFARMVPRLRRIVRQVAAELGKQVGQTVIVEPKPGAGGLIAVNELSMAPRDGHTLLVGVNSLVSEIPHIVKTRVDMAKEIVPLAELARGGLVLVGHPAVPAKTLPELIAYAKANPGKLNYATGNTTGIVSTAYFASPGPSPTSPPRCPPSSCARSPSCDRPWGRPTSACGC